MQITLYRHGATSGNLQHRYIGATDEPLCAAGIADLPPPDFSVQTVFVTPLLRTQQTAAILFPNARQCVIQDLAEMHFGVFENKNYIELQHNADYAAWLATNCTAQCPGGESMAQFTARTCAAFAALVADAAANGKKNLHLVAHGGTAMAVLSHYAMPHRDYFDWKTPHGGAWQLCVTKSEPLCLAVLAAPANKEE